MRGRGRQVGSARGLGRGGRGRHLWQGLGRHSSVAKLATTWVQLLVGLGVAVHVLRSAAAV